MHRVLACRPLLGYLAGALGLGALLGGGAALASDQAREQRIAEQIRNRLAVGQAIELRTGDTGFLAIHTLAETRERRGAVILLHDRGANPDWEDVIRPLRTRLPGHGWDTLSLQMPLAAVDAGPGAYATLIPEAAPRLDFALEFLLQTQVEQVVVIGHGLGARMALAWLHGDVPAPVKALVAIGLSADPSRPEEGILAQLRILQIPILDIHGSRDLDSVRDTARDREAAARLAGNPSYRQVRIEGADHHFSGQNELLVARIRAWMARTLGPVEPAQ